VAKRIPKFDQKIDGTRVRVYATRSEYEVIFNDDDISDQSAEVTCYPKVGLPSIWAAQAHAEWKRQRDRQKTESNSQQEGQ
jgi:hypothetical protein